MPAGPFYDAPSSLYDSGLHYAVANTIMPLQWSRCCAQFFAGAIEARIDCFDGRTGDFGDVGHPAELASRIVNTGIRALTVDHFKLGHYQLLVQGIAGTVR